jgi:hypothetical protein
VRPLFWIAADTLKEMLTRPGLLAAAGGVVVLIPLQTGIVDGTLSRMTAPWGPGVHGLLTTAALCPAMSAVIVFSGIILPRHLTHELEPILSAPVTDRAIAFGWVLPPVALAVAGSIPASAATLAGIAMATGAPPPSAMIEWLDLVLAIQVPNAWMACALLRSARRSASPGFMVWNVLLAFLGLAVLDAAAIWFSPGSPVGRRALWTAAVLAAVPPAWTFSSRLDREALIARE